MLPDPIEYHIYRGQPLPQPKYYAYVLAGNGLYKWARPPDFRAVAPLVRCRVAGLPDFDDQPHLLTAKIPIERLNEVLAHARRVVVEQMYHFHYLGSRWRVSLPRQLATPGRVCYQGGDDRSIILDLHSHHNMGAFFSATDDRDEQGCRFYGVIGHIYDRPEIALRVGVWGTYQRVSLNALFEVKA